MSKQAATRGEATLPPLFTQWFDARGWRLRSHQAALLEKARHGRSALLIAPTGGGKTLAGFLPSLIELSAKHTDASAPRGIHTLYISPLKALAVDVARNVEQPARDMALPITIETRTGDTPPSKRQRQRHKPPDILLTTPEQLALLLAHPSAPAFFSSLQSVILDELHALVSSKRGELLSLGLSRLWQICPAVRVTGLSATVADPAPLRHFLVPQTKAGAMADLVLGAGGARPDITVLTSKEYVPWSGHSGRYAYPEIMDAIRAAKTTLIFTNTRSQAEIIFAELWRMNEETLPIALHHGSLDAQQRRKVEAAMAGGALRAVVCTSTLDLGIDWGEVDQVIQMGAPKGSSRLVQRIGRANHRLHEPSRALLVPTNRFELLECKAACDAVKENALDGEAPRSGGLDVLAQHIWGAACMAPFFPDDLYKEITQSSLYAHLPRDMFDKVIQFVSTGGYALKAYDRYKRLVPDGAGRLRIRDPRTAQQYRLNVGTIIEAPALSIRYGRMKRAQDGKPMIRRVPGKKLGTVEEWFIEQLTPGDTFLFAGEVLRFEGLQEMDAYVTKSADKNVKIPTWNGGRFPLTTFLAERVRKIIASPQTWDDLPAQVREWLTLQQHRSVLPEAEGLLVETFPRAGKFYFVCYPFDGRLAQQALGTLLTQRLERLGCQPLGFCPSEYALTIWARKDMSGVDFPALFDEDMLGDDLESWLADASLMRRTFRHCAIIAGLIERHYPGQKKSGRQVRFSSDLIYEVLKEYEPDHILLQAAWRDASIGFLDLGRLSALLKRVKGRIRHQKLERVSPLAVPILIDVGRETVPGFASEAILREMQDALIKEAGADNEGVIAARSHDRKSYE